MNSPAIPEGPGSVAGAPHLPDGFTGTFTSRYIDTGDLRQQVVTSGSGLPLPLVHGWPQTWLAADPAALHASFAIYRALDATIAQNQQRTIRPLTIPVLGIGGAHSLGEQVADTMKLAADDVRTLVVPGCGHHPAEETREQMLTALTAFLAPYRDEQTATDGPGPQAIPV